MTAALLLALLAALPAPGGAFPLRPGRYVERGAACATARATLRYDGRRLRGGGRVVPRRAVTVHGAEGFTIGRRGRGGTTYVYCRPDEVRRS